MSLEHILLAMLHKPGTRYDLNAEFEGGAKFFWSRQSWSFLAAFVSPRSRSANGQGKSSRLAYAPEDLAATIFHCMGIGPNREFHDSSGRPYRIYRGQPIHALR